MDDAPRRPRIAVLAVHGVADQPAHLTQRQAAALLLTGDTSARYSEFVEEDVLIAEHPQPLACRLDLAATDRQCHFPMRSGVVSRAAASHPPVLVYEPKAGRTAGPSVTLPTESYLHARPVFLDSLDSDPLLGDQAPNEAAGAATSTTVRFNQWIEHESMREQLQGAESGNERVTHQTKVMVGMRYVSKGMSHDDCATGAAQSAHAASGSATLNAEQTIGTDCHVDVYELNWSDLSRLSNGLFSVFFEFYLLLFFFSRIGTITLERALAHSRHHRGLWRTLLGTHLLAESLLVMVIPVAHLCVLTLAACGAPALLDRWAPSAEFSAVYLRAFFLGLFAFAVLAGAFVWGQRRTGRTWWLLYVGSLAVIGLVVSLDLIPTPDRALLVLTVWLIMAAACVALMALYDRRRPGVLRVCVIMMAVTGLVLGTLVYSDTLAETIRQQFMWLIPADQLNIEPITESMHTDYVLFLKGLVGTLVIALLATAATVGFVLSAIVHSTIGALLFVLSPVELQQRTRRSTWTATLSLVLPGLAIILITFSLWEIVVWGAMRALGEKPLIAQYLRNLLDLLVLPNLVTGLGVLAVATGLALWNMGPAALSDFLRDHTGDAETRALGEKLDSALAKLRWSGEIFRAVLLVAMPLDWLYLVLYYPEVQDLQRHLVFSIGVVMFLVLFGTKGPLEVLSLGFRSGLDMGLDVTNWLRIHPRKGTARAAICRRYVSTLRHIARWRDRRTGAPYDALVIVSHSQGSVISAELLRFMQREARIAGDRTLDADLARLFGASARMPVRLLTFGCPLRQIYSAMFPHQYAWAGADTGRCLGQVRHGPDPDDLGLASWCNLYTSGDYVGRHLWYADDDPARWDTAARADDSGRVTGFAHARERCIGYGGHTLYWSGQLPDVSCELDRLIEESCQQVLVRWQHESRLQQGIREARTSGQADSRLAPGVLEDIS